MTVPISMKPNPKCENSLKSLAFYQQPTQTVSELRENNILGGKFKKYHKKSNRKTNKKRKYKKTSFLLFVSISKHYSIESAMKLRSS